ncbi:MAG TPA: isoaspartyl peptidase/L-asparaginase [Pirellulales bacterium]|jgi:beta-aspartyl-peptidase (threonine type)
MGFSRVIVLVALTLAVFNTSSIAAERAMPKIEFAIAIHGGAGIEPEKIPAEERRQTEDALGKALEVGHKILADGGTSLDAVEKTVRVLEDDPIFNAGRGAVFNSAGMHELDASIMDGASHKGGGVAGLMTVKNPISLARLVMTETPHVLLIGAGAERFADEMRDRPQIERVPNSYFSTEAKRKQWLEAVEREKRKRAKANKGTVGCVALDKQGNLAAGTSTGGLTNKKWGRVGDSPILSAGTYADNATCAVSCTGTGEFFIRSSIAFHVSALMAYKGLPLDQAVDYAINKVLEPDTGGLIAVDHDGQISMQFNTAGMARAAADSSGKKEIKLGK